jgi:4-hydroxythreonine-4-phosphate dehydrogenase
VKLPHLLITPGEPAGIGPDVTIDIAQQSHNAAITVIADPALLMARAAQLGLPLNIIERDLTKPFTAQTAGTLHVLPVKLSADVVAGNLDSNNADYVIQTLKHAASLCMQRKADAIVTGSVNKSIINQTGTAFLGHTEFFAKSANVPQTVMLFVVDDMKVALVTTHIPLAKVSAAVTKAHLKKVITILQHDLRRFFGIRSPRIGVCGLNPHAGENGYLGREEIEVIKPVIEELRADGFNLSDPLPADTIFIPNQMQQFDAVLAMYHDQALPVIKRIGFDRAVNMTLGLPFVRTSVDHGTALDIAGSGKADSGSMEAAIQLAVSICQIQS